MFKWFRRDKTPVAPPEQQPGVRLDPSEEEPESPPFSAPHEPPDGDETAEPADVAVSLQEEPAEGLGGLDPEPIDHSGGVTTILPEPDLAEADITPEVVEEIVPEAEDLTETAAETVEPEAPAEVEAPKKGFFTRLAERLTKTKTAMVDKVRSVVRLYGKVDEELLEEIEAILIQSDVGMTTTTRIIDRIRVEGKKKGALEGDAVLALFKEAIEEILHTNARRFELTAHPMIVLIVGVNGTGKTTTIGKIARQWSDRGKRVMMVAADTFRAAAIDQIAIWAQRTKSILIRPEEKSDPAAVVYEALETAKRDHPDLILIDTAGRLHTKVNLMEELKKIVRVIQKHYPDAPHETLLVLDATTGQNAVNQVKIFHDACTLTGLIMTKLDGTAKGGVMIACKDMYQLPILKIGIGESAEDLRDFDAHEFVEALFTNGGK